MQTDELRIAKRVTITANERGSYLCLDGGRWQRISSQIRAITLTFVGHQLLLRPGTSVDTVLGAGPASFLFGRGLPGRLGQRYLEIEAQAEQALTVVQGKLKDREGIVDCTARSLPPAQETLAAANGFLVSVPGTGRLFAIKPEALRGWVSGSVPIGLILAALERRGWLVRGADGKTTRQVVVPGLGRQRYYCLLPHAVEPGEPLPTGGLPTASPAADNVQVPAVTPRRPVRPFTW